MRKIVTDHIISPDGEFMRTGSEWIPAFTPATETASSAGMSLQDSAEVLTSLRIMLKI